MDKSTTYVLHPSVFYSTVNDKVALYRTADATMYSFNLSARAIFDFFSQEGTVQDLLEYLGEELAFDLDDADKVERLEGFLGEIAQNGILVQVGKASEYPGLLENELSDEFAESRKLFSATIELTYRCNERCRHCYIDERHGEELTTEQVKQVLDDLHGMGVLAVLFTGGEVFVRDDIFEILEYAHEKRFAVDIFTNGTLLDGDKIIRLKALWLKGVHFSVYSHVAEKHDAVTQIRGSFDKTIAAIKACSLVGIPTKIKSPLFAETIDDAAGIIELARKCGASIAINNDITPKKNGDTSPLSMRVLSSPEHTDIAGTIEEQLGNLYTAPAGKKGMRDRICGAGAKMISVDPFGKVFPCGCFPLSIGDVTEQSIEDIWNHSKELSYWREKNRVSCREDCLGCEYFNYCKFCPGEALMYTGNCTSKYQDACFVAEHKARLFKSKISKEVKPNGEV